MPTLETISGLLETSASGVIRLEEGDVVTSDHLNNTAVDILSGGQYALLSGVLEGGVCTSSGTNVVIPDGTKFFVSVIRLVNGAISVDIPAGTTKYVWGCSDGLFRKTTNTTPPDGFDNRTACLIVKATESGGSLTLDATVQQKARYADTTTRQITENNPLYCNQGLNASKIQLDVQSVSPSVVTDKGHLYVKTVSTKEELFYRSDGGEIQLTNNGVLSVTSVATATRGDNDTSPASTAFVQDALNYDLLRSEVVALTTNVTWSSKHKLFIKLNPSGGYNLLNLHPTPVEGDAYFIYIPSTASVGAGIRTNGGTLIASMSIGDTYLFIYTDSAWHGIKIAGSIATSDISDDAITNAKLANDAVGTDQILDEAVTNAKIAAGTINADRLSFTPLSEVQASNLLVDNSPTEGAILERYTGADYGWRWIAPGSRTVMSGTVTLADDCAKILEYDPDGSDRELRMPNSASLYSYWERTIVHDGSANNLAIKTNDGVTTIATLTNQTFKRVYWNGSAWKAR